MKWKTLNQKYEISNTGLIRTTIPMGNRKPGFMLKPNYNGKYKTISYVYTEDDKRQRCLAASTLLKKHFNDDEIIVQINDIWLQWAREIIEDNNLDKRYENREDKTREAIKEEEKPEFIPPKRNCNMCGTPTDNFRCDKCWEILKNKYDSDDFHGFESVIGSFEVETSIE